SVFEMERPWETQLVLKTILPPYLRRRVSGFAPNITAGPVMSAGEARHRIGHRRSQSSPSATSHDRPPILPQKSDVSTLTQNLGQHHRTETDGVHHLRRRA